MLKISKMMKDKMINELPNKPPEKGGIIGGVNDEITTYWIDNSNDSMQSMCSYTPDVETINKIIDLWNDEGITFFGMFHTHYHGVKTLSQGDMEYMRTIIRAMPKEVKRLLFPIIVFPGKELVMYSINKASEKIVLNDYLLM